MGEGLDLQSWYAYQSKRNRQLYKSIEFFWAFHFCSRVITCFPKSLFLHRNLETSEDWIFILFKIWKKNLYFYRALHSTSFNTNLSLLAQKLWTVVSLEVVKLILHFKRVFFSVDIASSWLFVVTVLQIFFSLYLVPS